MPCGFGLRTGDSCNTADGAGNLGRPAQQSADYWEERGEVSCGLLSVCLFVFLLEGSTTDWYTLRLAWLGKAGVCGHIFISNESVI